MNESLSSASAFDSFLAAWNRHQDLRYHGGTLAELAASRIELDRRRHALH